MATATQTTYSIRQFLAGKNTFLTGATGFLAKAVVEKILYDVPEAGKIFLLIRPRAKASGSLVDPRERLHEEILRNSVFSRLREKWGEDFEKRCLEKIVCVPGDLTHDRLGLSEEAFADLARQVHVIINSAATVVFDERLDLALDINTLSPVRLLELAQAAGASFIHVSTAYVSGMRRGLVPERLIEPLEAVDAQLPAGAPRPEKFILAKEIERLKTLCKIVKADCETQADKHGWPLDGEEARAAMRRALVNAGMTRARSLGWNDTYTYTKFLGEQLVQFHRGHTPTVIVRPSIIESSLREPEPGWLDGLRMADPLIVGFGKGRLADFPADPHMVLDIIPADLVVNAVLAAAAHSATLGDALDVMQVASSSENPLVFEQLYRSVRDYFEKHPMLDRGGKPVRVPHWKFPSVSRFRRRISFRYLQPVKVVGALVDGPVPVPGTRKLRNRLRMLHTTLEQLLYYVDIYSPYTNLHCRFETTRAREILERMAPEERERFDFDVRKIRWRHYLQDVHIPGLKRNILRMDEPPRAGAGEGRMLEDEEARRQARLAPTVRGVPQTIVELAARGADRFGDRPFLELQRRVEDQATPTRVTYREFFERAGALACKLRARLDLHAGDRIVLWGENCPEWCIAYLAISRAACAAVPLDRQMPPEEVARLTRFVEARAIIATPGVLAPAEGVLGPGQDLPPRLNLLRDLEPFEGDAWPRPAAPIPEAAWAPTPESVASILFTSGTTLAPKGVILTHANCTANALGVAETLVPLESDRFLSVLPLHHAFEFTGGFLVPLLGGSAIHYLETLRAKEVLETMKEAGITVVLGVPRLFQLFADGIRARLEGSGSGARVAVSVMSSVAGAAELVGGGKTRKKLFSKVHAAFGGKLRLFVSGGAPLDPALFHFFQRFGIPIQEGYGLTETAPILTVNPLGAPRAGSVGLPIPGVELKLREPDLQGIGEILARGPSVMQGYWRDPEATEKVFEDGWFRTGDLGRMDADGYLYVTGRVKDVIVTSAGKKVFPAEIESRLQGLAGVRECCVVGLPARQGQGEEVAVVVVPEPGADPKTIQAGIEKANQELPSHQRIARVEFRKEELPKTTTLKVQRGKLRAHYLGAAGEALSQRLAAAAEGAAAAAGEQGDLFAEVAKAVAETAGVRPEDVHLDQKLQLDLGLDSIGRIDLIGKLELRLNVSLSDEAMRKLRTVGDVVEIAAAAGSGTRKPRRAAPKLAERVWKHGAWDPGKALQGSLSKTLLQGAMKTTEKVFFNTYLSITATGLEHLPAGRPFVLASNHCSHLDTAAIRAVLGRHAPDIHVMGAKDYFFDTRLKSWFFSTVFNVLPFDREEHTLDGLGLCRAVLEGGKPLLIFPEGTRSVSGRLLPFKPGIGILALELDYPVLPVFVAGTYESLPKGHRVPRPSRVEVRVGPPVDLAELKGRKARENAKEPKAGKKRESERRRRREAGSLALYRQAAERIRDEVERLSLAP